MTISGPLIGIKGQIRNIYVYRGFMFTIYCIVTLYLHDAEAVKKNYIRLYATLAHPFYDHIQSVYNYQ